ncbi:Uncharacterised protein [Schaalia odontolytica]|uniref:Uncharacterized protein n=1 Tax=Schaalia odontolytica TaxID=1660 RepID=A0A2X0U2F4_9ACTO|nr:Uncharacterised protein [Schaalia odontolytica]
MSARSVSCAVGPHSPLRCRPTQSSGATCQPPASSSVCGPPASNIPCQPRFPRRHAASPRGPGCLMCPWAAARPLAVRAASSARRVVSKPGQAPPPPTGTAARPSIRPQAPQPHQTTARGHHSRTQQPFTGFAPLSCRDRIRGLLDSGRDNAPMTRHPCMKRTTPPSTHHSLCLKPPAPLSAPPRSRLKPLAPPSAPPRPEPQPLAPLSILPSTRLKPLPPPSTIYGRFWGIFRRQGCRRFHIAASTPRQKRQRFHSTDHNAWQRCHRFHQGPESSTADPTAPPRARETSELIPPVSQQDTPKALHERDTDRQCTERTPEGRTNIRPQLINEAHKQ